MEKYKINDIIKMEDRDNIYIIARGIVIKALKIVEASGNCWASRLLENKDKDTLEDLIQDVLLVLIENNYKITRECYRIVNKTLYNKKKTEIKNISINLIIEDNKNSNELDKKSYVEFLEKELYSNKTENKKIMLSKLNLTKKQLEILNIYSKTSSYAKTAEYLNLSSRGTVQNTIKRIQNKALALATE